MQKILLKLSGVCNWLIFLELLYGIWSLFGIFYAIDRHAVEWQTWAPIAFYGTLLYLIVTFKNRVVALRDFDEVSLHGADPSIIITTKFSIFLISLFGIHVLAALIMISGQGYTEFTFLFHYFSIKTVGFAVLFFLLPLGVVIQGIRLFILISKLKRLKTSTANISNV